MDPLAHTLVGASLAQTGLKRKTALGTATLVIAANLPDIDGVCGILGTDTSLGGRRGWTHGVLAMLVLPIALAAVMRFVAQRRASRRAGDESATAEVPASTISFRWLWLLATLGVLSHPFLDWMNSYGVRLLMPFSGSWFYGDALFIIDPVIWLLAAAPVVFASGRTKLAAAGWLLLLAGATAVVVVPSLTPPPAKLLWCVAAGLLVFARVRDRGHPSPRITAIVCLSAVVVYLAFLLWGTANVRSRADAWLRAQGSQAQQLVVMPMPAQPLRRQVVARVGDRYHFYVADVGGDDAAFTPYAAPLPVGHMTRAVEAALAAPGVQGIVRWTRLPAYEETVTPNGFRVVLLDARYARGSEGRLGRVTVELDRNLQVRSPAR